MNDWISIKERVPEYNVEVLTTDGKYCNVAERDRTTKNGEVFMQGGEEGDQKVVTVTHWMELPSLPSRTTCSEPAA